MDKRRLSAHGLQQLHLPLALLIAGLLFMVWASGSLSFFRAELDGISGRYAESYRQSYGQTHPVAHAAVDSAARSGAAAFTLSPISLPISLPVLTPCTPRSPTPLNPATCFAPSGEMRLQQQQLQQALRYLQQHAATARRWYIELPQPRQPFLQVRWQDGNNASAKVAAPAPLQLRTLDPLTGLELQARINDHAGAVKQDTRPADPTAMALGSLFFQLHYQAHGWLGPYGGRVIATLSVLYVLLAVGGLLYWRQRQGYHSHRSHGEQSHDYRLQSGWRVWHRRLALLTLPFCLLWLATGVATLMFAFNSAPITLLYSPAISNKTALSSQSTIQSTTPPTTPSIPQPATQPVTAQSSKSSTTANRAATTPASGGSADFYQQLFPATSMQFAGVAASSMATSAVSTPFAEVYPQDLLAAPPTRPLTTAVIDEGDEQWQRRWLRIWLELWQHLAVVDDEAINKAQQHPPSIHHKVIHKVTIDRPSDLDATLLFTAWPQQLWQHQHSLLLRWQDAAVLAHTDPRRGAWQMLRARLLNVHQAHIWPLWVNAVLASFAMAACGMLYCGMRLWYQQLGLSYARARQHRQHFHRATLQAQNSEAQHSHPPQSAWRSAQWQQRLAWGWICLCCHGFAMAALLLILLSQSPLWPWLMAQQGMSADRLFASAWLLLSFGFALKPPALTPPTKPPQIKPS